MAGSLMLINPARRPKKRRKHAKRTRARRSHNILAVNPKRRAVHRRRNPIGLARVHHRRRSYRRRHNPIGGGLGSIGSLVLNGLKGAAGAVAINAVTNFMPTAFKSGNVKYVTRTAFAILLGTVGAKAVGRHARPMAEGALAVNFADLINSFAGGMLPGSQLHGVGGASLNMGAMPGISYNEMGEVIGVPSGVLGEVDEMGAPYGMIGTPYDQVSTY